MPSSGGTGADISAQDASDLLHKLMTESTKVQAVFRGGPGGTTTSLVAGRVLRGTGATEGLLIVKPTDAADDPFLAFNPALAVSFKYGDTRAFPGFTPVPGVPRFSSCLILSYADQSLVALFDIGEQEAR